MIVCRRRISLKSVKRKSRQLYSYLFTAHLLVINYFYNSAEGLNSVAEQEEIFEAERVEKADANFKLTKAEAAKEAAEEAAKARMYQCPFDDCEEDFDEGFECYGCDIAFCEYHRSNHVCPNNAPIPTGLRKIDTCFVPKSSSSSSSSSMNNQQQRPPPTPAATNSKKTFVMPADTPLPGRATSVTPAATVACSSTVTVARKRPRDGEGGSSGVSARKRKVRWEKKRFKVDTVKNRF
jgi:hypothetical protein